MKKTEVSEPTNGAKNMIDFSIPYTVSFKIQGVADLLFHRWDSDSIAEKAASKKGSKAKKTDDIESYLYRNDAGLICLPGEYVRQSVRYAAKFAQDPRSPRKSAMDLFSAGVVSLTPLSPIGPEPKQTYDYEHRARVVIQRNGVTRTRPAFKAGWEASFDFLINLPEYIQPAFFHEILINAGRLIGVADFRPSYGRFQVTEYKTR